MPSNGSFLPTSEAETPRVPRTGGGLGGFFSRRRSDPGHVALPRAAFDPRTARPDDLYEHYTVTDPASGGRTSAEDFGALRDDLVALAGGAGITPGRVVAVLDNERMGTLVFFEDGRVVQYQVVGAQHEYQPVMGSLRHAVSAR